MSPYYRGVARVLALALALDPVPALAFTSGSTGTDGAFNPTVNTELDLSLKPSGVYNFTTINIPAGVTVTVKRNSANTPVVWLASGDVTIAGTIDLRGKNAPGVGAGGDGNQGDDGLPGVGGPGGFDGGKGGAAQAPFTYGGAGLGPGGGHPGTFVPPPPPGFTNCFDNTNGFTIGGSGGAFGTSANPPPQWTQPFSCNGGGQFTFTLVFPSAPEYGSSLLLPLIGGSGGGGGAGYNTFGGGGGGGGGGAILIASSGTVNVTGSILADGGKGGDTAGGGSGAVGGGGSGGAIRIVATTIAGNGPISARGGAIGARGAGLTGNVYEGSPGAPGRVRLEGDSITRTAAATPPATADVPGSVFLANIPTLTITSVAGLPAPANPTGNADITLPAGTPNPVTVTFATTGVPVGNTVRLKVAAQNGAPASFVSPAITGTTENGVASVSANLPVGPSVLQAQTTFTIVAALGEALRYYAQNERVEKIELTATFGGPSTVKLITVSGKTYEVPHAVLAAMAM